MFAVSASSFIASCPFAKIVLLTSGVNKNLQTEAVAAAVPAGSDVLFVVQWGVVIGSTDPLVAAISSGDLSAYGACRLFVVGEVQGAPGPYGHKDMAHATAGTGGTALAFGDGGHGGDALNITSPKLEVEVHPNGALRGGGGGSGMKENRYVTTFGRETWNTRTHYWNYQGIVRWAGRDPFGVYIGAVATNPFWYEGNDGHIYKPGATWHRLEAQNGIHQGTVTSTIGGPGAPGQGYQQAPGPNAGSWGQPGQDGGANLNIIWGTRAPSGAAWGQATWDLATGQIVFGKVYSQTRPIDAPAGAVKLINEARPRGGIWNWGIVWNEGSVPDPTVPFRIKMPFAPLPCFVKPDGQGGAIGGMADAEYGHGGLPGNAISSTIATVPFIAGGTLNGPTPTHQAPAMASAVSCYTLPSVWVRNDVAVPAGINLSLEDLAVAAGVPAGEDILFTLPAGTIVGQTNPLGGALRSGDLSAYGVCRLLIDGEVQGASGAAPATAGGTKAGDALVVTSANLEVQIGATGAIRGGGGGSAPVDTFGPWEDHQRTGNAYYTNYSGGSVAAAMFNSKPAMPAAGRPSNNPATFWVGTDGNRYHAFGRLVTWGLSGRGGGIGMAPHIQHPGEVGQGYQVAKTATGGSWGVAPPGGGIAGIAMPVGAGITVPFESNGIVRGQARADKSLTCPATFLVDAKKVGA